MGCQQSTLKLDPDFEILRDACLGKNNLPFLKINSLLVKHQTTSSSPAFPWDSWVWEDNFNLLHTAIIHQKYDVAYSFLQHWQYGLEVNVPISEEEKMQATPYSISNLLLGLVLISNADINKLRQKSGHIYPFPIRNLTADQKNYFTQLTNHLMNIYLEDKKYHSQLFRKSCFTHDGITVSGYLLNLLLANDQIKAAHQLIAFYQEKGKPIKIDDIRVTVKTDTGYIAGSVPYYHDLIKHQAWEVLKECLAEKKIRLSSKLIRKIGKAKRMDVLQTILENFNWGTPATPTSNKNLLRSNNHHLQLIYSYFDHPSDHHYLVQTLTPDFIRKNISPIFCQYLSEMMKHNATSELTPVIKCLDDKVSDFKEMEKRFARS